MNTLIIIDAQNDFMPGGSLAVPHGDQIVPIINRLIPKFDLIVATQDWHPKNHKSFASNHKNKKPFDQIQLNGLKQTLWPDHCVQGTKGAEFHQGLNTDAFAAIFRKGMNPDIDSYSGFYDNGKLESTGLAGYLKEKGAKKLYFCGLCLDICVYFTIVDALALGFECYLIEEAGRSLDSKAYDQIKQALLDKGVSFSV
ncbi:bifunctional nicotinamidase/pyrazinamidase [Facilibium subflavum]|uniref:bifunctional nicotinamidase/pyrazinamidase n=1 Tax=Facilibium subflavum TaxID=2219058 RepID=UPI000E65B501|nr:bifunctional nicotinamidase/pyrazinamidase [Facilibium subflavum]